MIDFEMYIVWKFIFAVIGMVVMFPVALWWLNDRQRQRQRQRKKEKTT